MRPPGRRSRPVSAGWQNSFGKTRRKPPEPKVNAVDIWKPSATVAAGVERDGPFLFVEGSVEGRLGLNQPPGHPHPGGRPIPPRRRPGPPGTAPPLPPPPPPAP